jgi:protein-tyrosine phosphatase
MKSLLFLCTGNYYRSRYAEILFNWRAEKAGLNWRAFSRGLALDERNPGEMSRHTMTALTRLGINFDDHLRLPLTVTDDDFAAADHVVAVKEAEHRRMIEQGFARWLPKVEFWHVHDVDCCGPEETLPHLDRELAALIQRLATMMEGSAQR